MKQNFLSFLVIVLLVINYVCFSLNLNSEGGNTNVLNLSMCNIVLLTLILISIYFFERKSGG